MLNLKALAFDQNLKQKDLAEILGVDRTMVSRLMTGRFDLSAKHLEKLKAHFGEEQIAKYEVPSAVFYQARDAQIRMYPTTEVEEVREEVEAETAAELRAIVDRFLASLERRDKQIDELIAQHKEMLDIIRSMSQK